MRIVAYTYVDHQEEIQYPVGLATKNLSLCEAIYLFGADERNTKLLEAERERHPLKGRIRCRSIGLGISSPKDIASAQNACLAWIRENEAFDGVIGLQADTMPGRRALQELEAWAKAGHRSGCLVLPVDHVRTYAVAHRTSYGCALFGKDSRSVFVEDGAVPDVYDRIPMAPTDLIPYCVDIGYYTPEMYYRHVERNAVTWRSEKGRELARLFRRDRDEFIRECLRKVRLYERGDIPLTAVDPLLAEHQEIMDYFNCHDDYRHVCELIVQVRKEVG